jgi:ParB-like chromosome segregation protein Spo0J
MTMELRIIPIEKIMANPFQPRQSFDEKALRETG